MGRCFHLLARVSRVCAPSIRARARQARLPATAALDWTSTIHTCTSATNEACCYFDGVLVRYKQQRATAHAPPHHSFAPHSLTHPLPAASVAGTRKKAVRALQERTASFEEVSRSGGVG